jgi:hypothetical protein
LMSCASKRRSRGSGVCVPPGPGVGRTFQGLTPIQPSKNLRAGWLR